MRSGDVQAVENVLSVRNTAQKSYLSLNHRATARHGKLSSIPENALRADEKLVLPVGIEPTTSPLPRECSTTELRQQARADARPSE